MVKGKEVAKRKGTEVGGFNGDYKDFPDTVGGREVLGEKMARWEFNGKEGVFIHNVDKSERSELEIVILAAKPGRVKFPGPYRPGKAEKPDCRSVDGIRPVGAGYAELCMQCEHNQWGVRGEPPRCAVMINILAIEEFTEKTEPKPFVMGFKRTGVKPWMVYDGRVSRELKRPIYSVVTTVSAEPVGTGKETYYTPIFEVTREMDVSEASLYLDYFSTVAGQFSKAEPTEEIVEEAEAVDEPPF